ncbi:hypothetical protein LY78DRAFT_593082, partial [Colletotrichum sublineola]
ALVSLITVSACAGYDMCHCTNADGTANNTITELVCNADIKEGGPRSPLYVLEEDSIKKCAVNHTIDSTYELGNCKVRKHCAKLGATGSNSFCEIKVSALESAFGHT